LHIARAKITNRTGSMLTEAKLSVINLNPENVGQRDFVLRDIITLEDGGDSYVDVASHSEDREAKQNLMSLQISHNGNFLRP
jgi:hypothetical protein